MAITSKAWVVIRDPWVETALLPPIQDPRSTIHELFPLQHRHELPPLGAGEKLPRAADLLVWVRDQLVPLRDPAHGAREGEDRGEHRHRYAERLVDDAGVEVDVGIALALD